MGVAAVSKKVTDTIMELLQDVYLICSITSQHPYLSETIIICIFNEERERTNGQITCFSVCVRDGLTTTPRVQP